MDVPEKPVPDAADRKSWLYTEHPSILTVIVLSALGILVASFLELVCVWCLSLRQFIYIGLICTASQLPFLLYRASVRKTCVNILFWSALMLLFLVPWNGRKVFLRDLDKVHAGMTANEVETIMGKYMKGTGWPVPAEDKSAPVLTDVATGRRNQTYRTDSGELGIKDAVVYRHSNEGAFNSDWGIVHFEDGRVTGTEFSPD
jgi:hypothetical protein